MPSGKTVMRGGAAVRFEPLKNQAAIEFLKRKVPELSKHWDDFIAPVHAHSFTIAGAPSIDFLTDMHAALNSAIQNGTSLGQFRKEFDGIVQKHGWSYKGTRGWRTRTIYQNNLRSAQMAGKWQTFQANQDIAPFLEYKAVLDSKTRPTHRQLDGEVHEINDVFWTVYYPPNDYFCRCTVIAHSAASLRRLGKSVSDRKVVTHEVINPKSGEVYPKQPIGVGVGWDGNVGISWTAPAEAMGRKLASLPPELAGSAYKHMVTPSFMQAVDRNWQSFLKSINGRPQNRTQFVGYLDHEVQKALASKTSYIIKRIDDLNAERLINPNENRGLLAVPDLQPENLSIVATDKLTDHLGGAHKKGTPSQWDESLIKLLPSVFHKYQAVLYDVEAGGIGVLL